MEAAGPEPRQDPLRLTDDGVPLAHLRPGGRVDVEREEARRLLGGGSRSPSPVTSIRAVVRSWVTRAVAALQSVSQTKAVARASGPGPAPRRLGVKPAQKTLLVASDQGPSTSRVRACVLVMPEASHHRTRQDPTASRRALARAARDRRGRRPSP